MSGNRSRKAAQYTSSPCKGMVLSRLTLSHRVEAAEGLNQTGQEEGAYLAAFNNVAQPLRVSEEQAPCSDHLGIVKNLRTS